MTDLSLVICTRNRAPLLDRLLQNVTMLHVPPGLDWEVVVVDNGSRDGTRTVAARYAAALPLRVVSEPTPGLSRARNRALDEVRGDAILWTDDDVSLSANWLADYAAAFAAFPKAAFFGGPIEARVEGACPKRLDVFKQKIGGILCENLPAHGQVDIRAGMALLPWGANMAMRGSALGARRFDERLGRRPGRRVVSEEETTFIKHLMADGAYGIWLPQVRVVHHTEPRRLRLSYVRAFFHGLGWAEGYNAVRAGTADLRTTAAEARARLAEIRRQHRWVPPWAPLDRRIDAASSIARQRGLLAALLDGGLAAGD